MPDAPATDLPGPWKDLFGNDGFDAFRKAHPDWLHAAEVKLDPANPKKLAAVRGMGPVVVNGGGKIPNLVTKESYGDLELECGFLMAKGSNSGIKMHAHYEVQLFDSFGKPMVDGTDCGGIYPKAEYGKVDGKMRYKHLNKGTAPKVNACKAPGEWQTLRIVFRAPKFDAQGKKTAGARFELVAINGQTVQQDHELPFPTGHAWPNKEVPAGPLLIQADHGPVAFRAFRVRVPGPKA